MTQTIDSLICALQEHRKLLPGTTPVLTESVDIYGKEILTEPTVRVAYTDVDHVQLDSKPVKRWHTNVKVVVVS